MAASKTVEKAVCDKCGDVRDSWWSRGKHGYKDEDCRGTYVAKRLPKEVLTGEFVFDKSYGNTVYLRHVESGRQVNIYTVDLLKVLAGRGIGTLTLTESKRGKSPCWKAEEVSV